MSVQQCQKEMLKEMLNFNQPSTKSTNDWKILIYDPHAQEIVGNLFLQKELSELGVLSHLNLHSEREQAPETPVIYLCEPTRNNIERIIGDFKEALYLQYYINFTSSVSRPLLEELAQGAVESGVSEDVMQVFCQYVHFISPEEDLFTLRLTTNADSLGYYNLHRSGTTEDQMEEVLESIVDGLFSVFATMGTAPVIRCPRGNAAEQVAERLNKKIKENTKDTPNSLFNKDAGTVAHFSQQRPLLVVLDRDIDIASCLHHTWTYQALISDLLDYKSGLVILKETDSDTGAVKKKFLELNNEDKMWSEQKGSAIPYVAEVLQQELDSYREEGEKVKKLKETMTEGEVDLNSTNRQLSTAVSSLPQLVDKKRRIDMHMSIAEAMPIDELTYVGLRIGKSAQVTAILDKIKNRHLDVFFESEEKLMTKLNLERPVYDILSDPSMGTPEDKIRLFLVYYICMPSIPQEEYERCREALTAAGCELAPLNYIKQWKSYSQSHSSVSSEFGTGVKAGSMFDKLVKGSALVMKGVKSLVVKQHNLPVTRIVDQLMELKQSSEVDDYRYFDPRLHKPVDSATFRPKIPYQECVVFVLSSGNYAEYQNLLDYAKGKGTSAIHKKITYGTTCLENGNQFLKQLTRLGGEM